MKAISKVRISSSRFLLKPFLSSLAVLSLAGCFGSSSGGGAALTGGGGGGGGTGSSGGSGGATPTPTAFAAAFDRTTNLPPSINPLTGRANYSGQVEVLTNSDPNNAQEAVFGDVAMAIDFAPGASRPISGTVGNFAGKVGGTDVQITGTLSTANAQSSAPNEVTVNSFAAPVTGTQITQTGIVATFNGDLTDHANKLSGSAEMTILGSFNGSTGEGLIGSNGVGIRPQTGAGFISGGRFYANRN